MLRITYDRERCVYSIEAEILSGKIVVATRYEAARLAVILMYPTIGRETSIIAIERFVNALEFDSPPNSFREFSYDWFDGFRAGLYS